MSNMPLPAAEMTSLLWKYSRMTNALDKCAIRYRQRDSRMHSVDPDGWAYFWQDVIRVADEVINEHAGRRE